MTAADAASGRGGKLVFWLVLALPSVPMTLGLASGRLDAEGMLHPTGEFAARFMIVALMITPLRLLLPGAGWLRWFATQRRALGVAAFLYALAHTVFYLVDMGNLRHIFDELFALGIWTGWAAFAIFLPLGITSNDAAMRALRSGWRRLHKLVYAAAILTLLHWMFVHNNLASAIAHFAPLALLELYRIIRATQDRMRPTPSE